MLEMNEAYTNIIEKKAENMYRTIKQKVASFPASNQAVKQSISMTQHIDLTPQESEQLSEYVSDDSYVQRQKEDLQELADLFKGMLNESSEETRERYKLAFQKVFKPIANFKCKYLIRIDNKQPLCLKVQDDSLQCIYESLSDADVEMSMESKVFEDILAGRMTFQRAFMSGVMKMKGDFAVLRNLDQLFIFIEE